MPVTTCWRFMCPISGDTVTVDSQVLPEKWARAADEVYSPRGLGILAKRILAHPDAEYDELALTQFPDAVLDDWFRAEPDAVRGAQELHDEVT